MIESSEKILIIDDEAGMCNLISSVLAGEGYIVTAVQKPLEGLEELRKDGFDLVITDMRMPKMNGADVLGAVKEASPDTPVILITAYSTVESAVQAMKLGAADYLAKPFRNAELCSAVRNALEKSRLRQENHRLKLELDEKYRFCNMVGQSGQMRTVFDLISTVARTEATVLIQGASGTGKEMVARAIHFNGARRKRPFMAIHCGGLPEAMLESELFGHVKGAFTDAVRNRSGLLESADGGTVFFDEIGDMPQQLQVKLLRFIQEREVRPVGSDEAAKIDVHIIAATHRDLAAEVKAGRFREDLYYRLAVVPLFLPPLRERSGDVPLLARHFIKKYAAKQNADAITISEAAMKALTAYSWPGNVRELENAVQHAVAFLGSKTVIEIKMLPAALSGAGAAASDVIPSGTGFRDAKRLVIGSFEENYLVEALKKTRGNISRAAKLAAMDRKNFYELMKKYAIDPSDI